MGNSIYYFSNYKVYLRAYIASLPAKGHGFRTEISKHLGIHSAYITQVLNAEAHFSLEQAEDLNVLLNHNEREAYFFLLLVQLLRAGTNRLKKRIQKQIDEVLLKEVNLKDKIKIEKNLSSADQLIYYSSWQYAAVHIILTIPHFQQLDKISEVLKIPKSRTKKILDYLTSVGLAQQNGLTFLPGSTQIYLSRDADGISRHHSNWRMKAIDSLDQDSANDLHFSAVVSVSSEDYAKIRENLARDIQKAIAQIQVSKEEVLCAFNLDFFKLTD